MSEFEGGGSVKRKVFRISGFRDVIVVVVEIEPWDFRYNVRLFFWTRPAGSGKCIAGSGEEGPEEERKAAEAEKSFCAVFYFSFFFAFPSEETISAPREWNRHSSDSFAIERCFRGSRKRCFGWPWWWQ